MPTSATHPQPSGPVPGVGTRTGPPPPAGAEERAGDAELMRSLQDGDLAAFEAIYDRHSQAVYGLAYRILRERATAEDVSQEAFLALWRNRHRYAPERGAARSWLLSMAHNRAIDAVRRQRGHLQQPLDHDDELRAARECTHTQVIEQLATVTVIEALQTLPETQRRAVELAYFGGLTQAEIAAELRIPLGTVKGRIRLALDKLACQLRPSIAAPG